MVKSKKKQQTGRTVLENRRLKKAKRKGLARPRKPARAA